MFCLLRESHRKTMPFEIEASLMASDLKFSWPGMSTIDNPFLMQSYTFDIRAVNFASLDSNGRHSIGRLSFAQKIEK